jgi:hypothetical protein
MVLGETKRGWWREARSELLFVSTLAAKIAQVSPKNTSRLTDVDTRLRRSGHVSA